VTVLTRLETPAAPPEDPGDTLAGRLHERCDAIIHHEVSQLARRTSALSEGDIRTVETSIRALVERLLLARLRTRPYPASELSVLFDLSARRRSDGVADE
ncbi:MAG: hypothetical protein ACRDO8_02615, partial [Nocardioidaceae bacterium]